MLRFIVKEHTIDNISGLDRTDLWTMDVECPQLERALTSGGSGENGSLSVELVGVEVLPGEGRCGKHGPYEGNVCKYCEEYWEQQVIDGGEV